MMFECILRVEPQQRSQQHAADHLVRHEHRRGDTRRRHCIERRGGADVGIGVALATGKRPGVPRPGATSESPG